MLHAAAESAERAAQGQSGGVTVPAAGDPLVSLDRPTVARDGAAYAFQFTIIRNQLFVAEGLQ